MQNDVWARDIYNKDAPCHLAWVAVLHTALVYHCFFN